MTLHFLFQIPPLGEIDLTYCVSAWIGLAERELCARPKTLLLETARQPRPEDEESFTMHCTSNRTILRHFLSADTNIELKQWEIKLNSIVSCLRNWNCMQCQIQYSQV